MHLFSGTQWFWKRVRAALLLWPLLWPLLWLGAVQAESVERPLKPVSVQINWSHQFQFAGVYAAIQQGFYRDAGLAVTVKSWKSGVSVVEEVVSGRADFGVGYGAMIADYAQGAPITLVMASFQFSPIVLLSHEPLQDLSALSGKKVMHYGNLQVMSLLNKARAVVSEPIREVPSSGDLKDFIERRVDYYTAYDTNEPYRLNAQGVPFHILDPKSYGVQNYGDLIITSTQMASVHPEVVARFKQATLRGWQYAITHQKEVVDFIMANYPVVKTRDALLAEARTTVRYVQSGHTPIGSVEPPKLLATALDAKEAGLISQAQLERLDVKRFIFDENAPVFTAEERAYLQSRPVVKLGNDPDWEPFEFLDANRTYSGITADYIHLFESRLGLRFEVLKDKTWPQAVELAKQGKVDMYACAVATPERSVYMNFTSPYLSFPMVLAAGQNVPFIDDYALLNGQTVAVVKDYWTHEYLKTHYPGIKLVLVESVKQGLDAVLEGRAMGYLGNLAVINHTLRKYGFEGIQVVGQFEQRFELAMGVQKDNPLLFSIIQKTLESLSDAERQAIYNRWIKLEMVNKVTLKQMLEFAIPMALVIAGLLILVLIYAYQKRRQKVYIRQIHELSFATEIDLKTMKILSASASFSRLSGYSPEELVGMDYMRLVGGSVTAEQIETISALVKSGKTWCGDVEAKTKQGEPYWVNLTLTPKKNIWGEVVAVLATRIDITDKKRVEQLSITDELTGLFNRRHFNGVLEQELRRMRREGHALAAAMFDIDYFKGINDTYGHQYGDKLLKMTSDKIQAGFARANDFVFRLGGEEFFVLSVFASRDEFEAHLRDVCKAVEAMAVENRASSYGVMTISAGGYFAAPGEPIEASALYQRVDECSIRPKAPAATAWWCISRKRKIELP